MKPIEPLEEISIKDYNKLTDKEKSSYVGIYKTKKIRKRSECETCGHFLSYYQGDKNIGKPIAYRKKSVWEKMNDLMVRDMLDTHKNMFNGLAIQFPIPIRFKK